MNDLSYIIHTYVRCAVIGITSNMTKIVMYTVINVDIFDYKKQIN